jgi:hypothetical protein
MRVYAIDFSVIFYCTGSKWIWAAKKYAIHTVAFYNFETF